MNNDRPKWLRGTIAVFAGWLIFFVCFIICMTLTMGLAELLAPGYGLPTWACAILALISAVFAILATIKLVQVQDRFMNRFSRKTNYIVLAVLIVLSQVILMCLLLSGCRGYDNREDLEALDLLRNNKFWPDEGCVVLVEIKQMPKDQFLKAVEENMILNADEKKAIRAAISPGGYSHCRLAKYKRGKGLFMSIDQCYPLKHLGTNSYGQLESEGGSGSLTVHKLINGKWREFVGMLYD